MVYPPCDERGCTTVECCLRGKQQWPELIGQSGDNAKAAIEKDNPYVTAVLIPMGQGREGNFCCNRVFVWTNEYGLVSMVPEVG
ncbi:hypothetical protein ACJRO7_015102 [Eucalyptus globulus]|uniref:Proteinase inhibitor n=1 Tax=Eucalyptus globulus TaxID=34317 RepID=A0ABD3L8E9_EUCGL